MAQQELKTLEEQMYGEDGKLTREGMELALANNHSVLYKTAIISDPKNLPSAATLAKGDAAKMAQAREALLSQQAAINAQLNALDTTSTEEGKAQSDLLAQSVSADHAPGTGAPVGGLGEGDTAGLDGDLGDPKSPAAKKAAAEAKAQKEAEEQAKKLAESVNK